MIDMAKLPTPLPLIPSPNWLKSNHYVERNYRHLLPSPISISTEVMHHDLALAIHHVIQFSGSNETMESYRTECNRFLNWLWLVADKSLMAVRRNDVVEYLDFCMYPPKDWICESTPPLFFYGDADELSPNEQWRPFAATARAQSSVDTIFSRLSSLFQDEALLESIGHNPVQAIRQKSKYRRRIQGKSTPRIITKEQIGYCLDVLEDCCHNASDERNVIASERALFSFSIGISLYLRVSEFVWHERHSPSHGHFFRDNDSNWWLKVIGKGNKERVIAVSDEVLEALMRWRDVLGLSPLPSPSDKTPMFPSLSNKVWNSTDQKIKELVPVTDTLIVWKTFRSVFKMAYSKMLSEGKADEAVELINASAHWLRHTGITNDVETREIDHVREDAGHSSIETTWRYVNATNRERAASKKLTRLFDRS